MSTSKKTQLNLRVSVETIQKLNEIVEYYQENTKIGKIYKGDVLVDIIDKYYDVMQKQKLNKRSTLS